MQLHPATVLGLWAAFVAFLPGLGAPVLAGSGFILLLALFPRGARTRLAALARRSRWLLVATALIYAFFTPGRLLWPEFPASPTLEGLTAGGLQVWRLVLVLASLAWVLDRLGREGLFVGLYALLAPLARFGLPASRFAVRLVLVLELAEGRACPVLSPRGLVAMIESPPVAARETVTVTLAPFTWRDALALPLGLGLLMVLA